MGLEKELGFVRPVEQFAHEVVMSVVLTGMLLAKEGDRVLKPLGLTGSQFNVLMCLRYQSEGGQLSQTQLGKMLLVNRANVTGLTDRMERAGWVRRASDPKDRRVNKVQITAAGVRLLEEAEPVYLERVTRVVARIPGKGRAALCKALESIRAEIRGRGK